ncbi:MULTISPECIES: transposase [unclassified Nonomuraea]|uniref:transposase n=1 Tax=unclassified Nonomuraea TaxID=2593643 RepID=UPI0033CDFDBC
MSRWYGPGGIEVEPILLDRGWGPRQLLRVVQRGPYGDSVLAYATSVREVAEWVDLGDLVEVIPMPQHAAGDLSARP